MCCYVFLIGVRIGWIEVVLYFGVEIVYFVGIMMINWFVMFVVLSRELFICYMVVWDIIDYGIMCYYFEYVIDSCINCFMNVV